MNKKYGTLSKQVLANYDTLVSYTSAFQSRDLKEIKKLLIPDVKIVIDNKKQIIVGLEKVLNIHKEFFDRLEQVYKYTEKTILTSLFPDGFDISATMFYNGMVNAPKMDIIFPEGEGIIHKWRFTIEIDEKCERITQINAHIKAEHIIIENR